MPVFGEDSELAVVPAPAGALAQVAGVGAAALAVVAVEAIASAGDIDLILRDGYLHRRPKRAPHLLDVILRRHTIDWARRLRRRARS